MKVSLVIPVFNESKTIAALLTTIKEQTYQPDEVVLVDGGSTDNTISILKEYCAVHPHYKVIEAGRAMPGKGRNIGTAAAQYEWIAYTDAGITLDKNWLAALIHKAKETDADIVYGDFDPVTKTNFEKAATIVYVPPKKINKIRGRSLPSSVWRKKVWESLGGFPDWRATEDLILMEKAANAGYKIEETTQAKMYWELRPDFKSTYKKFDVYSKYNVWAGRQAYWHYGVARQYLIILPFIGLGLFHHWLWLLNIPVWLVARASKRCWAHKVEFGLMPFRNPLFFLTVMLLILTIDVATFSGWVKAIFNKSSLHQPSAE